MPSRSPCKRQVTSSSSEDKTHELSKENMSIASTPEEVKTPQPTNCIAEVVEKRSAVDEVALQLKEVAAAKTSLNEQLASLHKKEAALKQALSEFQRKAADELATIQTLLKTVNERN